MSASLYLRVSGYIFGSRQADGNGNGGFPAGAHSFFAFPVMVYFPAAIPESVITSDWDVHVRAGGNAHSYEGGGRIVYRR
jgi:hypothetical protein